MPLKMSVHDSARADGEWAVMMSAFTQPPLPVPRQGALTPGRLRHAPVHLMQMCKVSSSAVYVSALVHIHNAVFSDSTSAW